MYKFDEQTLREGIKMGLGSQGIWTPELEDVMFNEITNEALHIHDVVGQKELLLDFAEYLNGFSPSPNIEIYEIDEYLSKKTK